MTSEGNEHKNSTVGKPFTLLDASREEGSRFLHDWEIESEDSVNLPPNAQDYNNMTLDECEIVSGVTLVEPRDAFKDPFQKINDNAETNQFALWKTIMPELAAKAKIE